MALDLRTSPYYDDFDTEKNFHRILFKPGYAVQSRELTQLQTILQEQIKRFGNHVFKDGSVVYGCAETFKFDVPYVKIEKFNNLNIDISDATFETYKTTLLGKTVSNNIGVIAKIVYIAVTDTNQRVLYLQYTAASPISGAVTFQPEEVLTVDTFSNKFVIKTATDSIGAGSLFTLGDGVVYAKGNFIIHNETTAVVEYFNSTPSKKVGYRVIENIVTYDDDVTLLDPAAGSYNYAAPGADRYSFTTSLETYSIAGQANEGFYLLFEVEDGKVKRAYNKPQYSELQKLLAQRTFDESGNYTVAGLNVNIREHLKTTTNNGKYENGDSSKLVYGIEAGKAYVEGYDAELKSTQYITVNKATDVGTHIEKLISTAFGNYVLVNNVAGTWGIADNNISVNLKNNSGTVLAKAKVRLLKYYSGSSINSATQYKLYLHTIEMQTPHTTDQLSTVVTITDESSNHCSVVGTFALQESNINSLIFPTTERAVVNFDASTDYFYWKKWTHTINPTGTISLDGNEQWVDASVSDEDIMNHFIIVKSDGTLQDLTGSNGGITLTPNSAILTLASYNSSEYTIYGLVKVTNETPIALTLERSWLKIDTTTMNVSSKIFYLGVSNVYDIENVYIADNGVTFPVMESAITSTNWTDITSDFTLDANQNDNFYDTSFIKYTGTGSLANKHIIVKYRYIQRNQNNGYINKNSYAGCLIDHDPTNPSTPTTGQEYKWIYTYQLPIHKSKTTGISYDLRDVIDFRPMKQTRAGYSSSTYETSVTLSSDVNNAVTAFSTDIVIPDPDREVTATFTYNLPRIDKVILTRDGEFKVLKGISSLKAQAPNDEAHAMTLAQINLAPYPSLSTYVAKLESREDYASTVRLIDNRRYTMSDIGDLEQRINRLEYFASLSLMENKVANMTILEDPTDSTSAIMAKRGILVDSFDGHGVGNIFNVDYNAAIDVKKKELRPAFNVEHIQFELSGTANKMQDVLLTGASHSSELIISNNSASKTRICGNSILGNFKNGILTLDPPQDMWVDTNIRPDVQANYQGNNDGWEFDNAPFNIHWNGWQTIWQGVEITSIAPVNVSTVNGVVGIRNYNESTQLVSDLTRSMMFADRVPENNLRNVGIKVLDVSVVPYIKQQVVTFIATGLLPNSVVKAYFDGEDVSIHCRYFNLPDNGASKITINDIKDFNSSIILSKYEACATLYGEDLTVSSSGTIVGQFLIPSNTFRTGNRVFKLEDSTESTSASTQFYSSGIASINDASINSTRFAQIRQDSLTDVQNNVVERLILTNPATFSPTSYGDPMAQTFVIEGSPDGVMITHVDLYFNRISTTAGITVQIREVINGYPGNKIVPFSTKTLTGLTSANTSTDASVATSFVFDSPVYLKNGIEYALVILPENNNTEYALWVSELGNNNIGTAEQITQQPFVGLLFIPNNNTTWTALEHEDLKFKLYKGVFDTTETTITLKSAPIDYITFSRAGDQDLFPGDAVKVYDDTQTTLTGSGTILNNVVSASTGAFINELKIGDRIRGKITQSGIINSISGTQVLSNNASDFTQLKVGDILYRSDNSTVIGKVASIGDPTNFYLTLEQPAASYTGNYYVRAIIGVVKNVINNNSLLLEENCRGSITSVDTLYKDNTSCDGYVTEVYENTAKIYINSGNLTEGDDFDIRTAVSGALNPTTITVSTIDDKQITAISPNFGTLTVSPTATISLKYRLMDSTGGLQDSYTIMNNMDTLELEAPYTLFSYSKQEANTQLPTFEIQATLQTSNTSISPLLDTRKLSLLAIENNIAADNVDPKAIYITRTVTLEDPAAEDLRVFLDVKMPESSSIKVYAKMQNGDGIFDDVAWELLTEKAPDTVNRLQFQEYTYLTSMPHLYNKFAVKIEMYSSDISKVPTIKNFRAVALI